ncbi:MAG TPA: nucleotidyltransferase family protein, partial [Steroidobacteraceae bacterium]|nr:nucleotidyltransferase family protein [Steroidobacteraceae bacterium]
AHTLAPIDMVLHAIVHLFEGGEMDDALRELVDLDQLLRHFGATEPQFWTRFWPRACELDLARPAFYGLRYAQRLLGTPVLEAVFEAARAWAPSDPTLRLMDWLVPRALFPRHPDRPDRAAAVARWLLYLRSHWLRMPPLMLARHLAYKAYRRLVPDRGSETPPG